MKIKFGAIVTDGRNKIGGHVASKNRAGNYLKTKSTPANPMTSYQSAVRSDFGALAQSWRGLTAAQRASWVNGAPSFPYTDIFGDTKILSGFGLYMQLNGNLNNVNAATLTTCPAPATVEACILGSAAIGEAGALTLVFLPAPVPAGHTVAISGTPKLSAGRALSKTDLRKFSQMPAATATSYNCGLDYTARFGAAAATDKIYIGVHSVLLSTGQVSPISLVLAVEE